MCWYFKSVPVCCGPNVCGFVKHRDTPIFSHSLCFLCGFVIMMSDDDDDEESYVNTVSVNDVPYFDWVLMDNIRIGSFVAIQSREDKDEPIITIARLEERQQDEDEDPDIAATTIRLRLFIPLFVGKRLDWYPKKPKHNHRKIEEGCGSKNTELYETTECVWIAGEKPDDKIKLLFPVFVFTFEELRRKENKWAEGMRNVFFVRYWHNRIYSYTARTKHRLEDLPSTASMGFVNNNPAYKQPCNLIMQRRCLHRNIWMGLYKIRKHIIKVCGMDDNTNGAKQGGVSLTIGYIPMECVQYIYVYESYVWYRKLHVSYRAGVIKFGKEDLAHIRTLLGISTDKYDGSCLSLDKDQKVLGDNLNQKILKRGYCQTSTEGKENIEGKMNVITGIVNEKHNNDDDDSDDNNDDDDEATKRIKQTKLN